MPDLPLRGRSQALADLNRLLDLPGRRVLTLTGLPGVGKSRLARELVTQRREGPSRVVVVETDQVYEAGLLERRIRAAVGIPGATPPAPSARAGRGTGTDPPPVETILLVDDAHRAPETGDTLRTLTRARPDLRVVVTARAPLYIPRETVFRVAPFTAPHPAAGTGTAVEDLAAQPAVQMFLDVADATGISIGTGDGALTAVAEICALVGGLPLAIELAAARSAAFSPTSLLHLLRDHPHKSVLGRVPGGAPDHDLFDAIAWTESLLSPQQRTLLHRLTAFRSPVPVDAVTQVTGVSNVVEGLSALVDMHLVQADHTDGATRFSLHPLVREHAVEQMEQVAPEEIEELHSAHIRWALGFTLPLSGARTGSQFLRSTDHLRPVGPDLRLALHRALDREDAPSAVRLALGLAPYWFSRGAPPGHTHLLARVRELPGFPAIPAGLRALLAGWHGLLLAETAETADAVQHTLTDLLGAVDLARATGPETLLRVLGLTLRAARFAEDREAVAPLCAEGRELARTLGWEVTLARFEVWSGMLAHQGADLDEARRWGVSAYRLAKRLDDPSVFLVACGFLRSLPGGGDLVPDLPAYEELLSLARRTGNRHARAWIQPLAALDAIGAGDLPAAADLAAEVIRMGRSAEAWGWCGIPIACLARIAALRRETEQEARFHGMLAVHLPVLRPSVPPWTLRAYEQALELCRQRGGATFDAAFLAGASLTHRSAAEEALAYAATVARSSTGDEPPAPAAQPVDGAAVRRPTQRTSPLLTSREQEVLALLTAGGTNKEISAALGISPKTVMHHTSNIYRKLEVRGRAQAVAWQLRAVQHEVAGDATPPSPPPTARR